MTLHDVVDAAIRWYRTRGAPRIIEREAEIRLAGAIKNFLRIS